VKGRTYASPAAMRAALEQRPLDRGKSAKLPPGRLRKEAAIQRLLRPRRGRGTGWQLGSQGRDRDDRKSRRAGQGLSLRRVSMMTAFGCLRGHITPTRRV
jgi:hypothetical protein